MPITDLSTVELAKHVRAIKACTDTDDEVKSILETLGLRLEDPRLNQILQGLAHEDELELLCRLMGTCTAICRLGQTPMIGAEQITAPDFIASFRPALSWLPGTIFPSCTNYQCMIEVKGTIKNRHSISTHDLERRMRFASAFGLPLVFAIRFLKFGGGLWLLIEAEQYAEIKRSKRKLRVDDLQTGIGHLLLDDYFLAPRHGLRMICQFNSTLSDEAISRFGALESMRLALDEQYAEVLPGDTGFVFVVLGRFTHRLIEVKEVGSMRVVTYEFNPQCLSLSMLLSKMNNFATGPNGAGPIDRARILARLDSARTPSFLISREYVESVFLKYPGFTRMAYDNPDRFLPKMASLFKLAQSEENLSNEDA